MQLDQRQRNLRNDLKNMIGPIEGTRLVGTRYVGKKGTASIWEFRCQCGVVFQTIGTRVRTGQTKSCGCLRSEKSREHGKVGLQKARQVQLENIRVRLQELEKIPKEQNKEGQIVNLLGQGYNQSDIARWLGISKQRLSRIVIALKEKNLCTQPK